VQNVTHDVTLVGMNFDFPLHQRMKNIYRKRSSW